MRSGKRIFAVLVAGGLATALLIASPVLRPRCTELAGGGRLAIPLSQLARGAISFFCYRSPAGERVRFILARDEAGGVHAVLDKCRQCGQYHKGYTYSQGELICRLCGNRYKIKDIEAGKASCVPLALPIAQRNGVVEVKVSDLARVNQLF